MSYIIAALRVKNEIRWIAEVLDALAWCDDIYLFDDHSTDGTPEAAYHHGARILRSTFEGLDEARDKEFLTSQIAKDYGPNSWIIMVDGDEVLEAAGEGIIKGAIQMTPSSPGFNLRILYLWNSRNQVRIDGVYGRFSRPSIFRLGNEFNFRRTETNGHMHCSSVPARCIGKTISITAALYHLGYMDQEDRIRKWKYYNSLDPRNRVEGYDSNHPERGSYPWIVQGDIPEVPSDLKLLHAGPLEVRSL